MANIGEMIGKEAVEQITKGLFREGNKVTKNVVKEVAENIDLSSVRKSSDELLKSLNSTEHLAMRNARKININNRESSVIRGAHQAYGKSNGTMSLEELVNEARRQKSMGNVSQINKSKIPESMSARGSLFENMSDRQFSKLENKAIKKNEKIMSNSKKKTVNETVNADGKVNSLLNQALPIAVGGGLIFAMANRGGNMSNSELYGQQSPYGY
jgi:hypothetical protein